MTISDAVERIERYIAEYEDAPNWGGPTMYPAAPKIADLKTLIPAVVAYQQMHEIATEQGYPSILEALEALARAKPSDDVEPSVFDLLEPLSAKLIANGGPDIRGGFARMTGGVDIPFIIEALTKRQHGDDVVERVKGALSPLVNEEMDEAMHDAWLTDLARAALDALRKGNNDAAV